ncbi:MAG: proprotein convertase P-domain-containing protein, partial [Candidatus Poribacteria bacterium]
KIYYITDNYISIDDNLKGENTKGTWKLKVIDPIKQNEGMLNLWKLEIKGDAAEVTVNLRQGWNFVSFPFLPQDKSISNVLSTIQGSYAQVTRYNASGNKFEHYVGNVKYNQFNAFEYIKGYLIYVTNSAGCVLTISGVPLSQQTIPLKAGWNIIGSPKAEEALVEEALKPLKLGVDYSRVCRYDTATKTFQDYTLSKKEFTTFKIGEAYYLYCVKDVSWTVEP